MDLFPLQSALLTGQFLSFSSYLLSYLRKGLDILEYYYRFVVSREIVVFESASVLNLSHLKRTLGVA